MWEPVLQNHYGRDMVCLVPNVPLPQAGKGDTWSFLRVCFPGLPKDLMGVLEDDNQSPGPFRSETQ